MLASGQIRHAVAARLRGQPLCGQRVFTSRAWPLSEAQLPAWRVSAPDQSVEPLTIHPDARQSHDADILLEGYVRGTETLDDDLDALTTEALEAIFATAPPADDLASLTRLHLRLKRIESSMEAAGEAALGAVSVTLKAEFHTRASAPQTIL